MDLTGQLSNPLVALQRMLDGKKSQVNRSSTVRPGSPVKQQQVRLSDTQKAELFEQHRQGAFKKELARAYGIHVETVRAIIRRHSSSLAYGYRGARASHLAADPWVGKIARRELGS